MNTFWQSFKKPINILAPMENVTDTVFRQVIARTGRPDVYFTEFTSTDAICSAGYNNITKGHLLYTKTETPLIVQIWGKTPKNYYNSAKLLKDMGFAGIDINMGCPDRVIVKNGSCGGLLRTPELAKEIYLAVKDAVGEDLPVSIKTRIGFNSIQTTDWLGFILGLHPDALTVHFRTVREMSKVPAHWDEANTARELRNAISPNTVLIGNGDIVSKEQIQQVNKEYDLDGVMIGRGIFQDPWIFNPNIKKEDVSLPEKLQLLIDHIALYEETWKGSKPADIMKRFYKIYVSDFRDAADFRMTLMESPTLANTRQLLKEKIILLNSEQ